MTPYSGQELKEDEYLVKIDEDRNTGFFTKLTKKGDIPVAFANWKSNNQSKNPLKIYVKTETYRSGWKIDSFRIGDSQQWAIMWHPDGFKLEVYLADLVDIIKKSVITNGTISGEYKWVDKRLVKKP